MKGIYLDGSVKENARIFEEEDSPVELGRKNGKEYELHMKCADNDDFYNLIVLKYSSVTSGTSGSDERSLIYTFDLLGYNREIFDTISEYLSSKGKPFAVADVKKMSDLEMTLEDEQKEE